MSENRVKLSVTVGEGVYHIITSSSKAQTFMEEWRTTNGDTVVHIEGVVDDMDANLLEVNFVKEEVRVVQIVEAKGL